MVLATSELSGCQSCDPTAVTSGRKVSQYNSLAPSYVGSAVGRTVGFSRSGNPHFQSTVPLRFRPSCRLDAHACVLPSSYSLSQQQGRCSERIHHTETTTTSMNAIRRYSFCFLTQLGVRMGFLFLFLPALSTAGKFCSRSLVGVRASVGM